MHLLPQNNVMLDFICMGPFDLPGARRKRQNTKLPGFDENCPVKVTFIHTCTCTSDANVKIGICTRMMKKTVFYHVHVLYCVTNWII